MLDSQITIAMPVSTTWGTYSTTEVREEVINGSLAVSSYLEFCFEMFDYFKTLHRWRCWSDIHVNKFGCVLTYLMKL